MGTAMPETSEVPLPPVLREAAATTPLPAPLAVTTPQAEAMVGGPTILATLRDKFGLVPLNPGNRRKLVWSVRLLTRAMERMETQIPR